MPTWLAFNFQDSNSPLMEHLSFFHDHTMIILTSVTILTLYMLVSSGTTKNFNRFFLEAQEVEMFWTIIPAFLLIFIALPSLKTLYMMEEIFLPLLNVKSIGYQWYWGYEYSEIEDLKLNSMIVASSNSRLVEVSNHLILPYLCPVQMIVSSKDVIHSWTIPSLGIKVDAMPGRMNQLMLILNRPGIFLGQCSEICGAGHSFMPITLESVSLKKFFSSLNS